MEPPGGRDSRFNLGYSMNLLSGETAPEIYGNPNLGRPSTSLQQLSPRHTMVSSACGGRGLKSDMYDERGMSSQGMGLEACGVNDISEDTYSSLQSKKSPPSNGKKTKGRVKIKMEYIENKLRRYTTFSKRKTGIMKKAYELSTLTGTQVMLLVASETGHVYTFATRKLQPMITSEAGKALIQTCLNSPDPPAGSAGGDQRMSATGFEETELTYNISDEDSKDVEDYATFTTSTSSEGEDEVAEDNLESQEKFFPQQHPLPKDSECSNNRITKPNTFEESKFEDKTKSVNSPLVSLSQIQAQLPPQNQTHYSPQETSGNASVALSSVPLLVPPIETTVPTSLMPCTTSTTAQIHAIPLLLQTSTGLSYATTPDGMFVGFLQGPNMNQSQLVAIPMANVATTVGQSSLKKTGNEKSS